MQNKYKKREIVFGCNNTRIDNRTSNMSFILEQEIKFNFNFQNASIFVLDTQTF